MEKLWDKNTGLATIILLFIILKKKTFLTPIALKNVQQNETMLAKATNNRNNNEKGIISVHNTNNINKKLIREVKIY